MKLQCAVIVTDLPNQPLGRTCTNGTPQPQRHCGHLPLLLLLELVCMISQGFHSTPDSFCQTFTKCYVVLEAVQKERKQFVFKMGFA